MVPSLRISNCACILLFFLSLGVLQSVSFRTPLEAGSIKPGYRTGYISNEALPPDEQDKELEKKQRAFEKFKTLKEHPSSSSAGPSVDGHDSREKKKEEEPVVEEYYVEHEISMKSARVEANKLNLSLIPSAGGCEECSHKEMEYCVSQVISDHCCCDGKYNEVFAFVPHTCYLGTTKCRPVATDCGEYMRLRECCCDKYLATKWKATLSKASNSSLGSMTTICFIGFGIVLSILLFKLVLSGN